MLGIRRGGLQAQQGSRRLYRRGGRSAGGDLHDLQPTALHRTDFDATRRGVPSNPACTHAESTDAALDGSLAVATTEKRTAARTGPNLAQFHFFAALGSSSSKKVTGRCPVSH